MIAISTHPQLDRLSLEVDGPVARIALRNPSLNIIDIAMMEQLSLSLAEVEGREDVCVIVLSGEDKAFSVGVDVAAHAPEKVEEMLTKFHAVIRALLASRKVTIATVYGYCLGGGAELAMMCDMVFTTESAQWGFPEIKLGCYPPVACTALAALVGQKRAAELILTGRSIDGRKAAEIGLANRAVPESELGAAVAECLRELRQLSPAALAAAKKASYAWDSMHFDKGLARAERFYFDDLMKTSDAHEGIRAFMEKRAPKWTGK
ncbi:MAG TPA: enoyl-CoA hydratase/isomerase family protein [Candidatus Sulfotelmatobacter sp.]